MPGSIIIQMILHNPSLIQTLLPFWNLTRSAAALCRIQQVADYTAGWELHPTPKNYYSIYVVRIAHYIQECKSLYMKNGFTYNNSYS